MIDQIINSVKGELGSKLVSLGLPESKTNGAIKLAKETVQGQLQGQISGGNLAGLTSLFNGKSPLDQSSLVKTMVADYGTKMITKLGVSDTVAKSVSTFIIPFVMSRVSNQVSEGGEASLLKLVGKGDPLSKIKSLGNMFKFVL
ncbi:MAG TPA: hypothetical protein DIS90_02050 [Cytophagales bacterium]|nr:hypothetical protein [Cytophagales bacterium]HCR54496.1 hypothetical protein [Cytophagales bacterium]